MATTLDPQTRKELAERFMVDEEECDQYNNFYEENILPRINKKFLAHMVAVVEEMIDAKILERVVADKQNEPSKKNTGTPTLRRYNIIVAGTVPPRNGTAITRCLPQGAIIMYKPNDDKNDIEKEKELRIFVAHELGHLLLKHNIIPDSLHTENHANLLAYFAISGKNDFYENIAPKFLYGDEPEIISKIQIACPVDKMNQVPRERYR